MKQKLPSAVSTASRFDQAWLYQIWLSAACASVLLLRVSAAVPGDLRRDATVEAVEQAVPSVVNIATAGRKDEAIRRWMEFMRRLSRGNGAPPVEEPNNGVVGSGVIIDAGGDAGYILTNIHVIEDASRIQVQLWDGREYEAQRLLGALQKDLALLKIVRRPGDKPFKPIRLAKDDDLLLGETVIAVGNPFGLGGSVSRGILSSKNRRALPGNEPLDYEDWLQTDADINPGNSGGPLINLRGELIGINVAIYGRQEAVGLGFAIPVKQISGAISDFFTLEWTASLWFGARLKTAPYPLTVREVQSGSPADRAGLRVGQEIMEVNGKPIRGLLDFNQEVASRTDHRASLTVLENGTRRTLNAELLPMLDYLELMLERRLGISCQSLTEAKARPFQLKPGEGLLINEVAKSSPADRAQIQSGFLLTAIDNKPVNYLVDAANAIGNKTAGERVQLTLIVPRLVGGNLVQLQSVNVLLVVR